MGSRSERWRIRPLELPRPWRYCSACAAARVFVCTERFRVNAQKKTLDVWLNYRCAVCEEVWKLPLFERRSVSDLDAALREAFATHDRATVWKYAFDVGRLRPHVLRVATNVSVQIERTVLSDFAASATYQSVYLDVPLPCDVRLERVLAAAFAVSRTTVQRWHERDQLRVLPEHGSALRKCVRDGQRIDVLAEIWTRCPQRDVRIECIGNRGALP
jgi:hypothetical protein